MIISYKVSEGERPEQPAGCPDEVYGIMNHCWKEDPAQRPTFTSLRQSIIAQQAAAPASSQDLQALFRDVLGSSDIKPAAASSDGYNKVGYHRLKDKALPGSCSPYHRLEAPIGGFKATPTPLEPENLEDALPVPEAEPYHDLDAVHKQYTSDQFIAASLSSSSSKSVLALVPSSSLLILAGHLVAMTLFGFMEPSTAQWLNGYCSARVV